jgi:hypothetical protein
METRNPYSTHGARRKRKSVFFGFQIGSAQAFRKECGFSVTAEEATWADACDFFLKGVHESRVR